MGLGKLEERVGTGAETLGFGAGTAFNGIGVGGALCTGTAFCGIGVAGARCTGGCAIGVMGAYWAGGCGLLGIGIGVTMGELRG